MRFFGTQILVPYMLDHSYKNILEIGSSYGQNADQILRGKEQMNFSIIDPCADADLSGKYKNDPRVKILRGLSVEILPALHGQYDCILIDGDHNWYTIFNELSYIENGNLLKPGGTIFLHDVAWPYARRDMYHDPTNIPEKYVYPYSKAGMVRGVSKLAEEGGFNGGVDKALHEGGPKNGVLTGVEDFLRGKKQYVFFSSYSQYGLGVIIRKGGAYLPKTLKWYFMIRFFDLKTFVRPVTKKMKSYLPLAS